MANLFNAPAFKSEEEEANWFDNHQSEVLVAFKKAEADGTLGRGTLAKKYGKTPTTTIRLDPTDIELAKAQAEERGLRYQTYLKMIIHQALLKESREAAKARG
jgi:predicted DNA binding CopG/RHH family protein